MKKILVTGATGILGKTVIDTLLKHLPTSKISVLTRKEDKYSEFIKRGFRAYIGDYNDLASLEKAMADIDIVLLISSGSAGDRMQEHRNVVDTAKKIGVKKIAYTSRSLKDKDTLFNNLMKDHFETEEYIMQSGLKYIIFRNALYMDVIQIYVGVNAVDSGIYLPAGKGKVAYALRSEQGEAMANILLNDNFDNQTIKLTGPKAYSYYDIATALSELTGREVKYNEVSVTEYESIMQLKGIPKPRIQLIAAFNVDIKNGQEEEVTNDLEIKLGRKATLLKDGLRELYQIL